MTKILIFLITLFPLHAQQYELSIAAIFQNEARWLKEWIEYHRLVGVDHFYLYNNFSSDNYRKILKPYIKARVVTLINWPFDYKTLSKWNRIQCSAYQHALKQARSSSNWLAIIDLDEFIVPVKAKNLKSLLKNYKPYGGITARWQIFGTSNIEIIPSNKLLIESLTKRSPNNKNATQLVKSTAIPARKNLAHYFSVGFL